MADSVILVHHSEIVLKGRKRRFFEKLLIHNMEYVLGKHFKISADENRLVVNYQGTLSDADYEKLVKMAGISSFSPALRCDPTLESIKEVVLEMLEQSKFTTFSIDAKRAYKRHPFTSQDVKKYVSDAIVARYQARPDHKTPEIKIYVELTKENGYVYGEKRRGLGGLPVGSSGRVLMLLSGGVDSAVASLMLIRRGCRLGYLHFHSYRNAEEALEARIGQLVNQLVTYGLKNHIFIASFTPFYRRILPAGSKLEVPLFRRYMFEVADRLASLYPVRALATGDSLAQVASQTLANIAAAEHTISRPVLRPLIGFSKEEILRLADGWQLSWLTRKEYKDCCSILGRHPATSSSFEKMEEIWQKLGLGDAVAETLEQAEIYRVTYRSGLKKIDRLAMLQQDMG